MKFSKYLYNKLKKIGIIEFLTKEENCQCGNGKIKKIENFVFLFLFAINLLFGIIVALIESRALIQIYFVLLLAQIISVTIITEAISYGSRKD